MPELTVLLGFRQLIVDVAPNRTQDTSGAGLGALLQVEGRGRVGRGVRGERLAGGTELGTDNALFAQDVEQPRDLRERPSIRQDRAAATQSS